MLFKYISKRALEMTFESHSGPAWPPERRFVRVHRAARPATEPRRVGSACSGSPESRVTGRDRHGDSPADSDGHRDCPGAGRDCPGTQPGLGLRVPAGDSLPAWQSRSRWRHCADSPWVRRDCHRPRRSLPRANPVSGPAVTGRGGHGDGGSLADSVLGALSLRPRPARRDSPWPAGERARAPT